MTAHLPGDAASNPGSPDAGSGPPAVAPSWQYAPAHYVPDAPPPPEWAPVSQAGFTYGPSQPPGYPTPPTGPPPTRRRRTGLIVIAAVLAVVLISGAGALVAKNLTFSRSRTSSTATRR